MFSRITGELAGPHCIVGSSTSPTSITPRSARHLSTPFMSKAKRPSDPIRATMERPSVAGVADAWLAFTCRFMRGTPSQATEFQAIRPDCLSSAISRHECRPVSAAESIPARLESPTTTPGFAPSAGTAVVT
jgi:hypothetical protein